jgi:hypothetical protein
MHLPYWAALFISSKRSGTASNKYGNDGFAIIPSHPQQHFTFSIPTLTHAFWDRKNKMGFQKERTLPIFNFVMPQLKPLWFSVKISRRSSQSIKEFGSATPYNCLHSFNSINCALVIRKKSCPQLEKVVYSHFNIFSPLYSLGHNEFQS